MITKHNYNAQQIICWLPRLFPVLFSNIKAQEHRPALTTNAARMQVARYVTKATEAEEVGPTGRAPAAVFFKLSKTCRLLPRILRLSLSECSLSVG
jgi:hypothetical protein